MRFDRRPGSTLAPAATCWRSGPDEVDADRAATLLADARAAQSAGDHGTAVTTLASALGLWRGAPLADVAYEGFAQTEIARLDELRLECVEERVECELAQGRHAEVVGELERLVADHPFRERLRQQLMLALYRCGRQTEALATYRDAWRALSDELGIEPGKALQELEREILNQDPRLDPRADRAGRERRPSRQACGGRIRRTSARASRDPGRVLRRASGQRPARASHGRARNRQEQARGRARGPRPGRRSHRALGTLLGGGRRAGLLAVGAGAPHLRP